MQDDSLGVEDIRIGEASKQIPKLNLGEGRLAHHTMLMPCSEHLAYRSGNHIHLYFKMNHLFFGTLF